MPWPKPIPATQPPESDGEYLIYLAAAKIWTGAKYGRITDRWQGWFDDHGMTYAPTHYMPQPPPPGTPIGRR